MMVEKLKGDSPKGAPDGIIEVSTRKGMPIMVDRENPVIEFTAHDRCDRCIARAYTLARKETLELLFCPHHSREFRHRLFDEGWAIIDDAAGLEELGYEVPALVKEIF